MTDDPIQREIEANQARKRDTEDVGLEENHIQNRDEDGNLVTDLVDSLFHPEDAAEGRDEMEHEYDDNTKTS